MKRLKNYLASLTFGRLILWFYFIWYVVVLVHYFDPSPSLWLTSIGLSLLIGSALWINTTRSGSKPIRLESWPAMRLFLFPFCVSSFSALVKGRGFFLIFSPQPFEMFIALGLCLGLATAVLILRYTGK